MDPLPFYNPLEALSLIIQLGSSPERERRKVCELISNNGASAHALFLSPFHYSIYNISHFACKIFVHKFIGSRERTTSYYYVERITINTQIEHIEGGKRVPSLYMHVARSNLRPPHRFAIKSAPFCLLNKLLPVCVYMCHLWQQRPNERNP